MRILSFLLLSSLLILHYYHFVDAYFVCRRLIIFDDITKCLLVRCFYRVSCSFPCLLQEVILLFRHFMFRDIAHSRAVRLGSDGQTVPCGDRAVTLP